MQAGAPTTADCTITMADSDFVDLMTGKIDGQQAFVQGKLKIQGAFSLHLSSTDMFTQATWLWR